MNLVIDVGNSRVKYGLFNKNHKLIFSDAVSPNLFEDKLQQLFIFYPQIQNSIFSASGENSNRWISILKKKTNCTLFSHSTSIPIQNKYKTPDTLGLDRIALAVSSFFQYPNKNCLIVDLGTCITYDFLHKDGRYLGGAISPGIEMRFKAMHNFTANLPFIKENTGLGETYIGKTTEESLKIGVYQAIIHEIEGFYKQYIADYENLTLVLTGGSAQVLAERVKNSIFANLNFQLLGLHQILIYNINANQK